MTEVVQRQVEDLVETRHPERRRAKLLLASALAGVILAACTSTSGKDISAQPRPSRVISSHETSVAATATTSPSRPPSRTATSSLRSKVSTAASSASSSASRPSSSPALPSPVEGLAGCLPYFNLAKYPNHEYEVCTAYIGNAAEVALRGFYAFGNNRDSLVAGAAKHHFETRYWDQPRLAIEQDVRSWPKTSQITSNHVDASVSLLSISANEAADRGVIRTQESWQVTAPNGTVLRSEPSHVRDATLCRAKLPGHILHEWVVVSNVQEPNFNCIDFDTSHGLKP